MTYTVPFTFIPGTTIFSSQANTNFSTGNNNLNTHEASTTGIHGVGAGAVVGTTLSQILTNKTLTAPTINSGALSGTFSGTPTYSGQPTFSLGITIPTTQPVNLNVGGTSLIKEGAADRIDIVTAGVSSFFSARGLLIGVDGSAGTPALGIGEGDTGLYRIADNNLGFSANGIKIFDYSDTLASFQRPVLINATTATTAHAFEVDASFLTSAYGAYVYSNSPSAATRSLFRAHNGNAGATGTTTAYFRQDAQAIIAAFDYNGSVVASIDYKGQLLLSSNDPPDANRITQQSGAKAYGSVHPSGASVIGYNCTFNSYAAGVTFINFTTPFANADYAISVTPFAGFNVYWRILSKSAGAFSVFIAAVSSGTGTNVDFDFTAFGTQ